MDVTRAIQVAVVRADMALCGAGNVLRAVIPVLIAAVLLYAVIRRWRSG